MPRQEFVEVGAVAFSETCGLADVAGGDLQDLRQVVAGELVACLAERRQLAAVLTE